MKIQRFISAYLSSNCYLVTENGHGFLLDPCEMPEIDHILLKENIHLDFILLTHEHADHITGVDHFQTKYRTPIVCSEKCAENIMDSRMNYSYYFESTKRLMNYLQQDQTIKMPPFTCHADRILSPDCKKNWQGHQLYLKNTPGHSQGSICCLLDDGTLFAGDTIFRDEKTITRFKGGDTAAFEEYSMPWLRSLSKEIMVYPGHFDPFPLGEWKNYKGGTCTL